MGETQAGQHGNEEYRPDHHNPLDPKIFTRTSSQSASCLRMASASEVTVWPFAIASRCRRFKLYRHVSTASAVGPALAIWKTRSTITKR